jgi:dihydroorotase
MSKLFQGARVICPATGLDEIKDLFVNDEGCFSPIPPDLSETEIVDCKGFILAPSLVDLEAQFGDPGFSDREDFRTGGAAAAAGGFSTVLISPATRPVIDDAAVLREIVERAPLFTNVEVLVPGALTAGLEGLELAEMGLLAQAGASAISNADSQIADTSTLRYALLYARPFGLPVLLRAGDKSLEGKGAMHEGDVSTAIGLRGLPAAAEEIGVARLIALARVSGAIVHITGVTTALAVRLIEAAKADGLNVTASTTAHHLLLSDAAVRDSVYDPNTRLMPPLRSEDDRLALLQALKAGTLDAVCSQHEPLTRAEKEFEFELAQPGAVGIQTAFNETVEALNGDLAMAIQVLSVGPGAILGLKRHIKNDSEANFLLWDPKEKWTVSKDTLLSRCTNSPILGREFMGRVVATYRQGKEIHRSSVVP